MPSQDASPLALLPSDATNASHAYAGDELYVLLRFDLVGGSPAGGARARALTVRSEGPGLDELALTRFAVQSPNDGRSEGAPAGMPPIREGDALVATFEDAEVVTAPALKPGEPVPHERSNGFSLWLIARPPSAGTFRFRVMVAMTTDEGELRATSDVAIEVLPMPRRPILPTWVEEDWLVTVRDALAC